MRTSILFESLTDTGSEKQEFVSKAQFVANQRKAIFSL
jgi:hypothetical protein